MAALARFDDEENLVDEANDDKDVNIDYDDDDDDEDDDDDDDDDIVGDKVAEKLNDINTIQDSPPSVRCAS